jgi:hypothetical protein
MKYLEIYREKGNYNTFFLSFLNLYENIVIEWLHFNIDSFEEEAKMNRYQVIVFPFDLVIFCD